MGTANTWTMATVMVATFSRSWRCKRSSIRSCGSPLPYLRQTPARKAKYLNTMIWTRLSKPKSVYPTSVTGVNEIIQHAISFTLFGTHVIFETPRYDYSVTGQTGAPHEILSMGPRVWRDATALDGKLCLRDDKKNCLCLTSPSLAMADEPGKRHDVRAH